MSDIQDPTVITIRVYVSCETAILRGWGGYGVIEHPLEDVVRSIVNESERTGVRAWLARIYPSINDHWMKSVSDEAATWALKSRATGDLSDFITSISVGGVRDGVLKLYRAHLAAANEAREHLDATGEYYVATNRGGRFDYFDINVSCTPPHAFLSQFFPEMLPHADVLRSVRDSIETDAVMAACHCWQDHMINAFQKLEEDFIPNVTDIGFFDYTRDGEIAWKVASYKVPDALCRALESASDAEKARFNLTKAELDAICARLTELNRKDGVRMAVEHGAENAALEESRLRSYSRDVDRSAGLVSILDSDPYIAELRKEGVFSDHWYADHDNTLIVDPIEAVDAFYEILIAGLVADVARNASSIKTIGRTRYGYTVRGDRFADRFDKPVQPDGKSLPSHVQRELNSRLSAKLADREDISTAFSKAGFKIGISPLMWPAASSDGASTGYFLSRFFVQSDDMPENCAAVFIRWVETPA